jgi:hypothetical protein
MTDMAELKKRKEGLNLAIVYVDPDAFIANFTAGACRGYGTQRGI